VWPGVESHPISRLGRPVVVAPRCRRVQDVVDAARRALASPTRIVPAPDAIQPALFEW
jgi:hypothetical protein